jgi:hypothetical protein
MLARTATVFPVTATSGDAFLSDPSWLDDGEAVWANCRTQYRYQNEGSVFRRGHRAHFFLTDKRLVAIGLRQRRLVHIPLSRISSWEEDEALIGRWSHWRVLKPILRIVVDEARPNTTVLGIAVPNGADWVCHLDRLTE